MREFIIILLIGIFAGVIDILPMLKMKLDNYSVFSAFFHYIISSFVIFNTDLFNQVGWLKGGIITLFLAIPVMILVAKNDKKSVIPMIVMSILLGSLMGIAGNFIL